MCVQLYIIPCDQHLHNETMVGTTSIRKKKWQGEWLCVRPISCLLHYRCWLEGASPNHRSVASIRRFSSSLHRFNISEIARPEA